MNEHQKNLQSYVNDMYSVEKHVLEAVERQAANKEVQQKREAYQVIQQIQGTLRQHVHVLDQHAEQLGGR